MSGYLLGVIGTVLISAILMMIVPEGKTSMIIKSTARLACLVSILLPVLNFLQTGRLFEINFADFGIPDDVNFIEYCSTISIENAENRLKECIEDEFSTECAVKLIWERTEEREGNYDTLKIKILKAEIEGAFSQEKAKAVENWIEKEFSCDAEVLSGGE